jgi:homoserine acetyltransferase
MGQTYEGWQRQLNIEGYTRHRTAQRCPRCRNLSYLMRSDKSMCFHCSEHQNKVLGRVLAGIACLLLVVCAGCQSPRHAHIEATIAGQQVKVMVMR